MDRVRLGRTDLEVSVACLGTGGHSRLGQNSGGTFEESADVVRAALDHGIDFIDTASTYGTESMVGAAIKGRRESVVVSSKIPLIRDQATFADNDYVDAVELTRRVEETLKRLGTEFVDVLYLHGVVAGQYDHAVQEALPVLDRLRRDGKIRYTAISERFSVEPQHDMLELAVQDGLFDVIMVGLNMMNQTALRSVLPAASAYDIGVQAIYAVRGKLATAEQARALVSEAIRLGEADPDVIDTDDPFGFVTGPGGASSLVEACYRFVRHAPGVDTVVTGTGNIDHLLTNIRSIGLPPLPEPVLDRLGSIFGGVVSVTAE